MSDVNSECLVFLPQTTILSDQLASLSTGLEAKSRLSEAKRGGSRSLEAWKNPCCFCSEIGEILGNPR